MRLFTGALILLLFCSDLFAWHNSTHLQMTRDAVSLMPDDFREIFTKHQSLVEAGILDPDNLLRDWQNHYFIPTTPEGGALDRIDKLAAILQAKLQKDIPSDTAKQFCYMAHYIADLWSPESILKTDTASNKDFMLNSSVVVLWEGYEKPVENLREYLETRAGWRWKLENSNRITTLLYSEAVNDIARVWLSLWQNSGRKVEPQPRGLLEHKREALQVRSTTYSSRTGNVWDKQWYTQSWRTYSSRRYEALAQVTIRNEQAFFSRLQPNAPFSILESSVKNVPDGVFVVMRLQARREIASLSIMHPAVRGPVATANGIGQDEVVKLEGILPLNARADQLEIIFGTVE